MLTLYIKTHNITGLKYFGKTINKNVHKYKGSGVYWKRHIKKHSYDVTTEIYAQFNENNCDIEDIAIEFSIKNNIIKSNKWANLQVETGKDGAQLFGELNGMYNKHHSDKSKTIMSKIKLNSDLTKSIEKQLKTKEKNGTHSRGSHNANAKIKLIFNQKDKLMYRCYGNMQSICKQHNLPFYALSDSLYSNTPIYLNINIKGEITKLKNKNFYKYKGWYVKYE